MFVFLWYASLTAAIIINEREGCEAAPNCRSRNRRVCQPPMSSCGECLPGFTGVQGYANDPCYVPMADTGSTVDHEVLEIDLSHWLKGTRLEKDMLLEKLRSALIDGNGFFYVKNSGISKTLISTMFEEIAAFFSQEIDVKKSSSPWTDAVDNSGYITLGQEGLDEDSMKGDPKESYDMSLSHLLSSIWNTTSAIEYWTSFHKLSIDILRLYAQVLELEDKEFFTKNHNQEWHSMRFLHYPPQSAITKDDFIPMRAGAHSDYGSISLLVQDDQGGLEVFDRHLQNWIALPPRDGTVLVNTADLLMRWTNDKLISSLHRVTNVDSENRNVNDQSRYSIPFFVHPNKAHIIDSLDIFPNEPRIYEPITSLDYQIHRLESTHFEQENCSKAGTESDHEASH
jgi:isopenicillin N synthase-like dioxygenase